MASSKSVTNLPTDETKVLLIHSHKYFFSFPLKVGACRSALLDFITSKIALYTDSSLNIIKIMFIAN